MGSATAQQVPGTLYAPSVWDLALGAPAAALPTDQFTGFACGTNGGPPSTLLPAWTGYRSCRAERDTGLREVTFGYDDEPYYWAMARGLATQAALYANTSVYSAPVIASALFDEGGTLRGIRLVTDPRADLPTRERAAGLANFLMARFDVSWACSDLPREPGESEYQGVFTKQRCTGTEAKSGTALALEFRFYRKPGQRTMDPLENVATRGEFESSTRFEQMLTGRPTSAATATAGAAAPRAALAARALDCPGCDLKNADLKRANLRGAKLQGADLSGANLHGANLAEADLRGAILTGANLNKVSAQRVRLEGADLAGAMLYDARLDGATLARANLRGALAGKIQLLRADLTGTDLEDADLAGARLSEASLGGADLSGARLVEAQLGRANLAGATAVAAVFWKANLAEARLSGGMFRAADFNSASLRGADLSGADFSEARLRDANLAQTSRKDAKFDGATLPAGFEP